MFQFGAGLSDPDRRNRFVKHGWRHSRRPGLER
jgi:hypothetical protein